MNQQSLSFSDHEISGSKFSSRLSDLDAQCWNRSKSQELAKLEGIDLNDDHWAVISFLRSHYLWNGEQLNEFQMLEALNQHFLKLGGSIHLNMLFNQGVVTQGRRLANIHISKNI
ncbi:MAG: TusE/DsrC/DsvC family sulfur relay protein [Gammaproteobacteria bacterium]|jgi:sulfur relay (sulfurtransferase) DsrC/TusE family protein